MLTSDGDYRGAIAAYDRAIAAHEDFATAYTGRARARLLAANPDYPVTRAFHHRPAGKLDRRRGGRRLEGARPRSSQQPQRRAARIDQLLPGGLPRGRAGECGRHCDQSAGSRSVAAPKRRPGRARGAGCRDGLARAGLAPLRNAEPSQRTRLLASTYLSYLARVGHDVPARADSARRLADRMVAIETRFTLGRAPRGAAPTRGSVAVQGLRYADDRLTVRLRWTNLPGEPS